MSPTKFLLASIILIILASNTLELTLAEGNSKETSAILNEAEETMASAYQAILKAEEAGANEVDVSSLLELLDEAGWYLALAKMEYLVGNTANATILASRSEDSSLAAQSFADELRGSVWTHNINRAIFTMSVSVVCMAVIALACLWTWGILDRTPQVRLLPNQHATM